MVLKYLFLLFFSFLEQEDYACANTSHNKTRIWRQFPLIWSGYAAKLALSCQKYELVWLARPDLTHRTIIKCHVQLYRVDVASLTSASFSKTGALLCFHSRCALSCTHSPHRKTLLSTPGFWKGKAFGRRSLWSGACCKRKRWERRIRHHYEKQQFEAYVGACRTLGHKTDKGQPFIHSLAAMFCVRC